MSQWREQNTAALIEATQVGTSSERLATLNDLALQLDQNLEVEVRRLAAQNSAVQEIVNAVDSDRITYLEVLYRSHGLTRSQARQFAELRYAAFVGAQVLWPNMPQDKAMRMAALFDELTNI
ncbi:MAG: hypothetical protein L3J82_08890 [Planctomycetes bacterium]|nr:hypothetical protein [Planctomycetota bacterium]